MDSTVSGLGTLNIKGIGTVEYTVTNDNNELVKLTIKHAYFVPDLQTRLLSPQQLISQQLVKQQCSHDDKIYLLRWNGNTKTIRFNQYSNLPILKTASGYNTIKALQAKFSSDNPVQCFKARREIPKFNLQPEMENDSSDAEDIQPTFLYPKNNKKTIQTDSRSETET